MRPCVCGSWWCHPDRLLHLLRVPRWGWVRRVCDRHDDLIWKAFDL